MIATTQHRQLAQQRSTEPELREVRHGVGAGPAQRGRDEQQQAEVPGGEPDRIPQGVGTVLRDQPGDAEERGGGQVLPGDGGGVPPRPDAAGRDQEIGGRAGQPDAVDADRDGGHSRRDEADDGRDGNRLGHVDAVSRRSGR